ncbi:MAG: DM13 domain-containing protein [Pseudomonadota bacterium]
MAEQTLSEGGWTGLGYDIDGGWSIVDRDSKRYIVFDENFDTKNGPDLKVYLSKKSVNTVQGRTVVKSSIEISPLKSASGTQEYEIPADVELDDFKSLLIHCEAYSHLWGGSDL